MQETGKARKYTTTSFTRRQQPLARPQAADCKTRYNFAVKLLPCQRMDTLRGTLSPAIAKNSDKDASHVLEKNAPQLLELYGGER